MVENTIQRRRVLKTSGVLASSLALAGCSGDTNPTDAENSATENDDTGSATESPAEVSRGGTLRIGLLDGPSTMNPYTGNSVNDDLVQSLVYASGTILDPTTYQVRPWVFSDWTVENVDSGNPDIFVSVRENQTWTDGEELTIDDIIFTYQYLLDQEPGFYSSQLGPIESVGEASNDYDIHIELNKKVSSYSIQQLSLPILRRDIYEGENLQRYNPGGDAVGLGYGHLTQYEQDTSIEVSFRGGDEFPLSSQGWLEESDRFRTGGPFLDKVRFRIYGSQSALENGLLQGEVDTIKNTIRASKLSQVQESERLTPIDGLDSGWRHVLFNLRRTPLDDIGFRQAMGFLWDDYYYRNSLFRELMDEGDFPIPPGYTPVRPESAQEGAEIGTHPASNAFQFRGEGGSPNIEGIRSFLTSGQVITGDGGTYVGQDYPGSLTGVKSSVSEQKHDYSFGPVESQTLQEANVEVDKEIRVNGNRIPEIRDGPLEYILAPPKERPKDHEMGQRFVQELLKLGVPTVTVALTFNTLNPRQFREENFDMVQTGWAGISPFGAPSLYNLFHSQFADDHSVVEEGTDQKNSDQYFNNAAGYGLFDAGADELLRNGVRTMDLQERQQFARQAAERIYLDFPIMVNGYQIQKWPVNSQDFSGFIEDITSPGQSFMWMQWLNVHQNSS